MEVGIYFGMPFDEYLSLPLLNASGIKELNISETDFWARSWMNPDRDDLDEETRAKIEGRAYHKRILEGRDEFYKEYALEYEDDGDPDVLRGNDQMKAALTAQGIKGLSGKTAESLSELCEKFLPHKKTLYKLKKTYEEKAEGRELIAPKLMRHIEFTAKMVEMHPDTRDYFVGGYPEVTVIFEAFGEKFKIRFDYLKVWDAIDLKTFANQFRATLTKAVRKAFANQKYHIQGSLYLIGLEMAKRYASQGRVFGDIPDKEWLKLFSEKPCDELRYCFIQKGVAPAVIPLVFSKQDTGFAQGLEVIRNGVERYKNALRAYGTGYWVTSVREERFHYEESPSWINDI